MGWNALCQTDGRTDRNIKNDYAAERHVTDRREDIVN